MCIVHVHVHSPHLLPDPTILVEADGAEGNRKTLKTITWPLMDEDALASTYVTKVLTCLSKWRVKLQAVVDVFNLDEDETDNSKQNLCLICPKHVQDYIYIYRRYRSIKDNDLHGHQSILILWYPLGYFFTTYRFSV